MPPDSPLAEHHASGAAVLVVLARLRPRHWFWGWNRIAFGSWLPHHIPGLRFIKTLGSGRDGGFGLMPSASRQGLFCVFESTETANHFIDNAPLMQRYRERSDELLVALLNPYSARGSWDGMALQAEGTEPDNTLIAALTRASIRPPAATAFWQHAPAAQQGLESAPGCLLAVGLGEAPILRQATFSVWKNTAAMDAYARTGAHLEAIRAAWRHEFFSESMFVRFSPLRLQGDWKEAHFG